MHQAALHFMMKEDIIIIASQHALLNHTKTYKNTR